MRARRAGFTLIEVLVALVIMATMAGVLVISLPGFDQRRAEREADRLAAFLSLICEQAELSGREIGLHLSTGGYGFSLSDRDVWLPFASGHRFEERKVEGVSLSVPDEELPPVPDFERPPQATCWPTGELSALDVRVVHGDRARARVRTASDTAARVEISDDGREWRPLRDDEPARLRR